MNRSKRRIYLQVVLKVSKNVFTCLHKHKLQKKKDGTGSLKWF